MRTEKKVIQMLILLGRWMCDSLIHCWKGSPWYRHNFMRIGQTLDISSTVIEVLGNLNKFYKTILIHTTHQKYTCRSSCSDCHHRSIYYFIPLSFPGEHSFPGSTLAPGGTKPDETEPFPHGVGTQGGRSQFIIPSGRGMYTVSKNTEGRPVTWEEWVSWRWHLSLLSQVRCNELDRCGREQSFRKTGLPCAKKYIFKSIHVRTGMRP